MPVISTPAGWLNLFEFLILVKIILKKSLIRETSNLLTDAVSRTDTILERLRDLSEEKKNNKKNEKKNY